ncbi:phage integrase SAM-like domain-containing protein [Botrimarina sp.]|uniref:tyrosine-type recombinase/integrase n=1 Tax=Botrimarina sp. TaxID=2795802 RepID=UPI0032EFE303
MATLAKNNRGGWYIQFEDRDGRRQTLTLGKVPKRHANDFKRRIEYVIAAHVCGMGLDLETSRWLAGLNDRLAAKLARVGLAPERSSGTLGAFIEAYTQQRQADPKVKASTIAASEATHKHLRKFFGDAKPLRDIRKGDAARWRIAASKGRAENTLRKWVANAKKLFNAAIADELIERNPFDGMPSQPVENREREHFVSVADAAKVLAACPSVEWKLIFGLARFGGLRCPSEVLALRWGDVLWDQNRFIVRSDKTAHHDGHGMRFVPLWPEVRSILEEAHAATMPGLATPGDGNVVTKTRDSADNLRTQMGRIVERAGVEPWPKLFQNCRATRATEVANEYGEAKEAKWIGHSRLIARKHYLQITDDDFARAACAANALQTLPALSGNERQPAPDGCDVNRELAASSAAMPLTTAQEAIQQMAGEWVYQDSNLGPLPYQAWRDACSLQTCKNPRNSVLT